MALDLYMPTFTKGSRRGLLRTPEPPSTSSRTPSQITDFFLLGSKYSFANGAFVSLKLLCGELYTAVLNVPYYRNGLHILFLRQLRLFWQAVIWAVWAGMVDPP